MTNHKLYRYSAIIEIIGINPFVYVPDPILQKIFKQAGTETGPIPIHGTINDDPYKQTLVKYSGAWRLYINTKMLHKSPTRIGETIDIRIAYDPESRVVKAPDRFVKALKENKEAQIVFDHLSPSRRSEIIRYLAQLKTEATLEKNINRAISFLSGKGNFGGRDKP